MNDIVMMIYILKLLVNVRNCAPWNGALTVTGGSIGLSGCSNGYGRGTSHGIHLGPMTGEAPIILRCDTLLCSRF